MCDHKVIEPFSDEGASGWACTACQMVFIPAVDVPDLDGIAGVMEAVLWGVMERAVEKYGKEVVPEPAHQCEVDGHEFDNGTCVHCGNGQFLGGSQ